VKDGVVVRGPNWKVPETLPPRAKESSPFATSFVQQQHSLNRKVLQEGSLQVPGKFLVKAFRVDVGIESKRCARQV
jgi:hypothetical protein